MTRIAESYCLASALAECGLFADGVVPWRVAAEPFGLTAEQGDFFQALGRDLMQFYQAADELFAASLAGKVPGWVAEYLTMRIDAPVKELGAGRAFLNQNVRVIRPDVLLTKNGYAITELDSVPGGIGWTAALNKVYGEAGFAVVGEAAAMENNFSRILREAAENPSAYWAIVVSEEAGGYRDEMLWLGRRLREMGMAGEVLRPEELRLEGKTLVGPAGKRIEIIYRFFELFDYRSIAAWELIVYALKAGQLRMTPPVKSHLEEKLLFALFHHSCLQGFWRDQLGQAVLERLRLLFPKTWILDPRPLPPQAVVPDLKVGERPVQRWEDLFEMSQKQRRLVVKPSGYSPLAWGSRGVVIGHDVSQERFAGVIQSALENFGQCPYVLQEYHDPRRVPMRFFHEQSGELIEQEGRVRLCPYYFVHGGQAHLSGILATICTLDKKLIHGMRTAVMAPCVIRNSGTSY